MRQQICDFLCIVPAANTDEISEFLGFPRDQVQAELHKMDDEGDVFLSVGWYRLSEAMKQRLG